MSGLDLTARGLAVRAVQSLNAASRSSRLRTVLLTARDVYPVMAVPPVVTLPATGVSQISGTGGYAVSIPALDPRLTYVGGRVATVSTNRVAAATMTGLDGNRITSGMMRIRFMTDAPRVELAYRSTQNTLINAIVDGAVLSRTNGALPQSNASGNPAYWMMDFGADATSYFLNQAFRAAAVSGYAIGDILTVVGGTFTRPAKLRVVTGGGVVSVEDGGDYSVVPTGTLTTTGGTGTGLTINGMVWSRSPTAGRRMRRIELLLDIRDAGMYVAGLVVPAGSTVLAWPVPDATPKLLVVGDSQNQGTYQAYPVSHMGYQVAQRLGLMDGVEVQAQGGTGWVVANGNAAPWSNAGRIGDMIAARPDVILFDGSQNDGSNYAAITAAVAASLQTLQVALPTTLFVFSGTVKQSTPSAPLQTAALAAGIAQAPDLARIRLIDNGVEGWFDGGGANTSPTGSGNNDIYSASDNAHLNQAGIDYRAAILAERVRAALLTML